MPYECIELVVVTFHNDHPTHGNPFPRSIGVDGGFAPGGQSIEMFMDQRGYPGCQWSGAVHRTFLAMKLKLKLK